MVWRLLTHPGNPKDGHVGSGALQPKPVLVGEGYRGDPPVEDSLIAIVVLMMVVWEFIQSVIPEKTRGERLTQRDAETKNAFLNHRLFGIFNK
jgi:hypothetical protein